MIVFVVIGLLSACALSVLIAYRLGRVKGGREAVMRLDTVLYLNRQAEIIGVSPEERIAATERVLRIDRRELNSGLPIKHRVIQPKEGT